MSLNETESLAYRSDGSAFVASLAKGLRVIRCFGEGQAKLSLSEVAERTGFSRATARRFLLTLTELGYANSDGKYFCLTPKVLTLGNAYLSSLPFWETSRVFLEQVTQETQESSNLAVLDGGEVVYVARSAAPHRLLSVGLFAGARLPAHATAMGQVLLASLSDLALTAYIDRNPLERFTASTLCSPSVLRARLEKVRAQGFAFVDQELELGLRSIAVPIKDARGETVAAINVSANAARVDANQMIDNFLPPLLSASSQIASIL